MNITKTAMVITMIKIEFTEEEIEVLKKTLRPYLRKLSIYRSVKPICADLSFFTRAVAKAQVMRVGEK